MTSDTPTASAKDGGPMTSAKETCVGCATKEREGADIAPYWAHYAMTQALRKLPCQSPTTFEKADGTKWTEDCRSHGSLCITEYCATCYARVWWASQQSHKSQSKRTRSNP